MGFRISRRVWPLALPFAAGLIALVAACSDDDTTNNPAGTDSGTGNETGTTSDGGNGTDSGNLTDGGTDASDAGQDADAALPPLCNAYPNADIAADPDASAGEGEDPYPRYTFIAIRSILGATAACEIMDHFEYAFGTDENDMPILSQYECFGQQLAALAGCTTAGQANVYNGTTVDGNGFACLNDAGASVHAGFNVPGIATYTANDFDLWAEKVRAAAVKSGLTPADADRLKALILAQRAKVVTVDAGPGDAGYSQPACE